MFYPHFFSVMVGWGLSFELGFWKVFGPGACEVGLLVFFFGLRLFI